MKPIKPIVLTALVVFAALIVYGIGHLPDRASPDAPPNTEESAVGTPNAAAYYIENAYTDADTPNMVTVTLADYRGFDTLGETTVIFAAGLACALILRSRRRE